MRLINVWTTSLGTFSNESTIPPYAILSHTWGDSEVTFQDFSSLATSEKRDQILSSEGYYKIAQACKQAQLQGLSYLWADTCCINKESSAELSEAINSMFRWYGNARVCYAYLDDIDMVNPMQSAQQNEQQFWDKIAKARWFTRGWTLQELIAPRDLAFYIKGWKYIGNKLAMRERLTRITGVNKWSLTRVVLDVSVAERMSWAARRETTKEEDMAYCLMGLFDVNMPLLYGEGGAKAFVRLQEEIMKDSDDQSLFAWSAINDGARQKVLFKAPPTLVSSMTYHHDKDVIPIFATHPCFFRDSDSREYIRPSHPGGQPYELTNIGVRMRSPLLVLDLERSWYLLVLNCHYKLIFEGLVGLAVKKLPGDGVPRFLRLNNVGLFKVQRPKEANNLLASEVYLCKKVAPQFVHSTVKQMNVPHARIFLPLTPEQFEKKLNEMDACLLRKDHA
jgi:hypothetical protein